MLKMQRRLALNKWEKKKNGIKLMCAFILLSAFISMTLYGCEGRESQKVQEGSKENSEEKVQIIWAWGEKNVQKSVDRPIGKKVEPQPIDFVALKEMGYEILYRNIATETKSVSEDNWLLGQLEYVFEVDERMRKLAETADEFVFNPTDIEYFLFDFNGDGKDEYIILLHGTYWGGGRGTSFRILSKTEDGQSEELFDVAANFDGSGKDYPLAVLDDRVDGYYSFVLPWTSVIWKYNKETGKYSDAYKYRE